jgi:hypothetical protein
MHQVPRFAIETITSRAVLARMFAPMIAPPHMTSRDLLPILDYSVAGLGGNR